MFVKCHFETNETKKEKRASITMLKNQHGRLNGNIKQ